MKIAVLCGGLSPERNVSISSGTKIAGALKENGHQVVLLDMFFGLEDYTGDIARVFDDPPALGGTRIDESAPDLAKLPCVVKPDDSGSSIGVSIANDAAELRTALEAAAREGSRILIEQYVRGREVQIGILGDKALPSIEIIPAVGFYDYRNKYQPGAAKEITPAEIPAETEQRLADAALTVFRALNLSAYSRADFILDDAGELWFLEINTLPGMTPTSLVPQEAAAVGISYSELCEQIIAAALHK